MPASNSPSLISVPVLPAHPLLQTRLTYLDGVIDASKDEGLISDWVALLSKMVNLTERLVIPAE